MMLEGTLHEIRELKKEIAPHKGKGLILPSYNKFNDLILKSKFNILKKVTKKISSYIRIPTHL